MSLSLHFEHISALKLDELKKIYASKLREIFEQLQLKSALGADMTGWIPWIFEDHSEIFTAVKKIREDWVQKGVKVVVVIGTGGSYLGPKACLEFVEQDNSKRYFEFRFLPYFSPRELSDTLRYLKDRKFSIVVISKSGGTLESAVSFRLLRALLFEKEREEHYQYIISVTTLGEGVLYELSKKHNYHIFGIPKNIGGRYSALTPVGLVPAILGGISAEDLIIGAKDCHKNCYHLDFDSNSPFQYAAYRHFFAESGVSEGNFVGEDNTETELVKNRFLKRGVEQNNGLKEERRFVLKKLINSKTLDKKDVLRKRLSSECLISYEPKLGGVLQTMKQLFAESEGKNDKGLMPVILDFSPDLHSVGQLLQEGKTSFFETVLWVRESESHKLKVEKNVFGNEDKLDWLSEVSLYELNYAAFAGTLNAHTELKNINVLVINIKDWSAYSFGYLYFFSSLVAMFSAYLFEQNPFDQPGVEAYKERMKTILREQHS